MIRTLLIASLATLAATEAEPKADAAPADPYLVYGGYPYTHGLTYGGLHPYYTLPVVKAAEAEVKAADEDETKKVVPALHYPISYGYPLHHYYGKRDADAEPTADADAKAAPWLAYSGYAGYPYTYGHLPYYTHPVVTKKVVKAADGEEKAVVPLTLPYGVSTTTATATPATLLSRLLLARPSSPPSTTMARGPLMLSPLLMPMLRLTLG